MSEFMAHSQDSALSYKPSAFYFRLALRRSKSLERAVSVGLLVCTELEELKAWIRTKGMIPPRFAATAEEARAKGLEIEIAQEATRIEPFAE
jgi:hypothetical protein